MKTLRNCSIVAHIHDELVIEADMAMSEEVLSAQMSHLPYWQKVCFYEQMVKMQRESDFSDPLKYVSANTYPN